MSDSPVDIAVAFIETLPRQDMAAASRYLAEDVIFEGPMTRFSAAGPYLEAMGEFSKAVAGVDIVASIGDDERAMVVYEMRTEPFGTLRAMEYFTVRDGRIRTDMLVFDTHELR
jgi:hypothetical protein